jgi:cytochrome c
MNPFVATATAAALLLGAPALAATDGDDANAGVAMAAPGGDVAAGETAFAKQCASCHIVKSGDGEVLAGNRAIAGPNLYGITGGPAGAVADFKYGKAMAAVQATGTIWTEENFVAYVQDPSDWLKATLDDKKARSKMGWKVRDPQDAADLYAFLHSLAPHAAE